ncbi:hypothetical protein [Nocardia macrotermitis]|uniref:Uncharacterized protein n=1 Tax=Nocardia macrotermitis TaxID=2585198 RepID=A0A7K0D6H7_9NOCA|nr:hypothetical protein [Nocardia macrotermitis]MQY21353.1 hypothetical protein [Nocardia macrotermitis]
MHIRGIEFTPDEADPQRVTLTRGLSGEASRVEISYRIEGGLTGSRVVQRSAATFAHLRSGPTLLFADGFMPHPLPGRISDAP